MNPLTNVKNINKLNQIELERGTVDKKSWHDIYKESAWIFVGGLAYGLTEGDILSVFSQYGEIVNINLVRDKKTGKTKGFCFLCYANQKSTVLAVDNLNGIKVCGRTIRVDHVANYKPPKENENEDDITKQLKAEGCAPRPIKVEAAPEESLEKRKIKKVKKEKKKHKKHKKKDIQPEDAVKKVKVKKEKFDPGYAKYELSRNGKLNQKARGSESDSSSDESSDGSSRHMSNQGSAKSKATHRDSGLESGSGSKAGEHNRSKTGAYPRRNIHDVKRRHNSSSSDESAKTKKPHRTGSSKSERSESLLHQPSVSITMSLHLSQESDRHRTSNHSKSFVSKADERKESKSSAHPRRDILDVKQRRDSSSSDEAAKPHSTGSSKSERSKSMTHHPPVSTRLSPHRSEESHRYRSSLQSKSKDSKKRDRSVSPTKERNYSKHSHRHRRRDSSSSESDTYHKRKDKEGERSYRKHSKDREKKDSHSEKHRDYSSSSNMEYYNSDKKSKRSYENGNGSPDPNRNKSHKHLSRSSRTEREK